MPSYTDPDTVSGVPTKGGIVSAIQIATIITNQQYFNEEINNNAAAITAETTRAETAESAEITRAEAAEATLTTNLSDEKTRAEAAESANDTAITDETTRAEAAEALKAPLESPDLTGIPTAPTATAGTDTTQIATTAYATEAVAAETTRAEAEEAILNTAIGAETTRAEGAESTLTTNLTAETTRAESAEGTLTTDLNNEITNRGTAITAAVATETTRAEAAEATLTTNLASETTRAEGAESTNANAITAETTRAEAAEALKAPLASPSLTGTPVAPTAAQNTTSTQIATTAFAQTAVENYVLGHNNNLFANGYGNMGNNYNMTPFVYDPTDTPIGSGAFKYTAPSAVSFSLLSSEYIPVNPNEVYEITFWTKQGDLSGAGVSGSPTYGYWGADAYDSDFQQILTVMYDWYAGSALTTLAAPLNPGDTVIQLTSAAGWYAGSTTTNANNNLAWWSGGSYVSPNGAIYQPYTYTRTTTNANVGGTTSTIWSSISGNTLNLNVAWTGPALAAGTPIANTVEEANNLYCVGGNIQYPTSWTKMRGQFNGSWYSGAVANNVLPAGAAFIRLIFLGNYTANQALNNTFHFAGISVNRMPLVGLNGGDVTGNLSSETVNTVLGGHVPVTLDTAQTLTGVKTLPSPALTGTPTAPTATTGNNTTQVATTAFVQTAATAAQTAAEAASLPLTGGPVIDKGGQLFNVKAYGATGNGTTNDSTAIRAAVAAALAVSGIVFFPPGSYLLTGTDSYGNVLTLGTPGGAPVRMIGSGEDSTILKINQSATNGVYLDGLYGSIEDMYILQNAGTTMTLATVQVSSMANTAGNAPSVTARGNLKNVYIAVSGTAVDGLGYGTDDSIGGYFDVADHVFNHVYVVGATGSTLTNAMRFGGGAAGNVLACTLLGCYIANATYGLNLDGCGITWYGGGGTGFTHSDIYVSVGSSGPTIISGYRGEVGSMALDSAASNTVYGTTVLDNCNFRTFSAATTRGAGCMVYWACLGTLAIRGGMMATTNANTNLQLMPGRTNPPIMDIDGLTLDNVTNALPAYNTSYLRRFRRIQYYNTSSVIVPSGLPDVNDFQVNTTGAGSAALGTNCPAVTPGAPYTWKEVITEDGSIGYTPIWK